MKGTAIPQSRYLIEPSNSCEMPIRSHRDLAPQKRPNLASLKLQNPARRIPPPRDIDQRKQVAFQPSLAIDPRLRKEAARNVGGDIAPHQLVGVPPRHRALTDQIDRVGDLRIAEADAGRPTELDPQM